MPSASRRCFSTTLLDEYRAAHRMSLSPATLVQLARSGIHASFAGQATKARLPGEIDHAERRHSSAQGPASGSASV